MTNQTPDDELTEVLAGMDPIEVKMAQDLLEDAGIDSFIFDAQSSRMLGSTAAVPVRLMVRSEDAAEAREKLASLTAAKPGDTPG